MRGTGTNAYYVAEVDPTTGAIPVNVASGAITVNFSGATGSAVPAYAAFMGGTDGTNLRGVKTDTAGELQIDVLSSALPSGAATETTLSAINTKTPSLGQAVMASSSPVVIASNQSTLNVTGTGTAGTAASGVLTVQGITSMTPLLVNGSGSTQPVSGTVTVSNLPTTVDVNAGAATSSTPRVSGASRTYSDSFNKDYSGGSVTTAAWVQLISSTAAAINLLCITDTSGQVMELGTGTAASETRVFLIAQGFSGCIPLRIAASTRVAIRAVTATASTGYLTISGMN